MSSIEILRLIYLKKTRILGLGILVFIIGYTINYNTPLEHFAHIVFHPKPIFPITVLRGSTIEVNSTGASRNTVFRLIRSNELQEHIVNKFNLVQHYKLDSSQANAFKQAIEIFSSTYYPEIAYRTNIKITVKDRNPVIAAKIAQEIVNKLDELYQQDYLVTWERDIDLYESYLESVKSEYDNYHDSLKNTTHNGNDLKTFVLHKEIEYLTKELVHLRIKRRKIMSSFETTGLASLVVIEDATPHFIHNIKSRYAMVLNATLVPFCIAIMAMMFYSLIIVSLERYKEEIKLIFKKEKERP
ncbi:MAG: hypothetical protein JKY33_10470 [Bacteroidia bacterium]|nr:hypothetical protein [Bacteroidia bacterium]